MSRGFEGRARSSARAYRARLTAGLTSLAFVASGVSLASVAGFAQSARAEDVWQADEPARTSSSDLDRHRRSRAELEERTREAGDLDGRIVESGTLEGRSAEAGDPDARAVARDPDALESESQRLGALPESPPGMGPLPFETPNPASWAPSSDPAVLAARKTYRSALARARAAIATYDEMRDENHPRGEPRLRIVRERDAAIEALREAKRALAEAERAR